MLISSSFLKCSFICPSKLINPSLLEFLDSFTLILQDEGKQIGLNDKLFGAMGTINILLTPFCTIGPPADRAYAVEPVGVEIKIPSPAV